jgi:hypothetical protein
MQLNGRRQLREQLALATAALLNAQPLLAQDGEWDIDAAILFYSEGSDRVSLIEPVVAAGYTFDDESRLQLKLVADSLTGATPNGATPSKSEQTFTQPSGKGSYTTSPGDTPLDDTFRDTRVAVSADYNWPVRRTLNASVGGYFSNEYDFQSVSANAGLAWDLNNRNTTLSAGVSIEENELTPVGGVPTPFASMAPAGTPQPRDGDSESKTVTDLLLGAAQVVNRDLIMQINYGYGTNDGYTTDPYKLLSVVDPVTGEPLDYVYEKRPDSRVRQTLYAQGKYNLSDDVIDLSYRYYWDDWDITSHTADLKYRWSFDGGTFLEPRVRWYTQSAAEFFRYSLVDGEPFPEHATADYRQGEFEALTLGLRYGGTAFKTHTWSIRGEIYDQSGDSSPDEAIGEQKDLDLFPGVEAVLIAFSYSLFW